MKPDKNHRQRLKPREVELLLKDLKRDFCRDFMLDMPQDTLLPSVNELTEKYDISFAIARKFYDLMQEEGIIKSIPRKGFFIADATKISHTQPIKPLIGMVGYLDHSHPDTPRGRTAQTLEFFEKKTNEYGWRVKFFNMYPQRSVDNELLISMAKTPLSAVLLLCQEDLEQDIRMLSKLEIPIIKTGDHIFKAATNIDYDNFLMGYNATEYLLSLGHKKIVLVNNSESPWAQERTRGYLEALAERNVKPAVFKVELSVESSHQCVEKLKFVGADAVFCTSDKLALILIEAGFDTKTTAIMGVDDTLKSRLNDLSTIQKSDIGIAETAFKQLVNYFVHNIELPEKILLKGTLLKRGSTESVKRRKEVIYA
jgi:DNA-binding LacI/PurR family transcriptional regulator